MENQHQSPNFYSAKGPAPFFSVILLAWKSNQYIEQCLNALKLQTFNDFEIILLNNGSPEPFPLDLLAQFPSLAIKYLYRDSNIGFAAGNNYAAKFAKGQYLVLLNSDAFPKKNWLETIVGGISRHPNCVFASKIIMDNDHDRLDSEGDSYHISGLAWHRSYRFPVMQTNTGEGEVFSPCGAAAVYPKAAFDKVGGFDEDYFAYYEDVDLGFRLRLAGYRCVYLPPAVVFHVGSGSAGQHSKLASYYNQRNMVWTFFKDLPFILLILLIPFHLATNLLLVVNAGFHKQGSIYFRAKWDALRTLPLILKKRGGVHQKQAISPLRLLTIFDKNPMSPILEK